MLFRSMTDVSYDPRGYGGPPPQQMNRAPQSQPMRAPMGGARPGGPSWMFQPSKSPTDNYTFGNMYVTRDTPYGFYFGSDVSTALPSRLWIFRPTLTAATFTCWSRTSMYSPRVPWMGSLGVPLACQLTNVPGRKLE